jgi:DNA repair protein RadC
MRVGSFSIKEMAPDERPREKLRLRGPLALDNADLLALILNTGIVGESVVPLSQRLLGEYGGFLGLMKLDLTELERIHGLGPAKAAKLKATLEIASRVLALNPDDRPQITAPDDIVNLIGIEMAALEHEQLRVVILDSKHRVQSIKMIYQGSVNQAQIRISEIFRSAIRMNAVAIVIVHNHPSGDPTPSAADIALTAEVAKAGALLDIEVLDHLIIGHGRHTSLRRLGLGFALSSNSHR